MDTFNGTESWLIQELKPTTEEITFRYYPGKIFNKCSKKNLIK